MLSTRGNHDFFDSPFEYYVAVSIHIASVSSVKVPFRIESIPSFFIVVKVAHKNVATFDTDLTKPIFVRIVDFALRSW